jgi:transposase
MKFQELDDVKWNMIAPLLPSPAKEGRPRADDRIIVNGILYVLITGCRWIDVPTKYGDDSTMNRRLKNWEKRGVWQRIMNALTANEHAKGRVRIDELSIDSSTIEAKKGRRARRL